MHNGPITSYHLGGGGRGEGDLWASHDFQGERRGDQSLLTEIKRGTIKIKWLPMRGILKILQSFGGGGGMGKSGCYIASQPKSNDHSSRG